MLSPLGNTGIFLQLTELMEMLVTLVIEKKS